MSTRLDNQIHLNEILPFMLDQFYFDLFGAMPSLLIAFPIAVLAVKGTLKGKYRKPNFWLLFPLCVFLLALIRIFYRTETTSILGVLNIFGMPLFVSSLVLYFFCRSNGIQPDGGSLLSRDSQHPTEQIDRQTMNKIGEEGANSFLADPTALNPYNESNPEIAEFWDRGYAAEKRKLWLNSK